MDLAASLKLIEDSGVIGTEQEKFIRISHMLEDPAFYIESSKKYKQVAQPKAAELFDLDREILASHLRFRVLKDKDPAHFIVGAETKCCQVLGGQGNDSVVQSFVNPLAGVLVLEVNKNNSWEIVAQSYFHYVPEKKQYILDNVEQNAKNVEYVSKKYGTDLKSLYAMLAKEIKDNLPHIEGGVLAGHKYSKIGDTYDWVAKPQKKDHRYYHDIDESAKQTPDPAQPATPNPAQEEDKFKGYTDFDPNFALDLQSPRFEINPPEVKEENKTEPETEKKASLYRKYIGKDGCAVFMELQRIRTAENVAKKLKKQNLGKQAAVISAYAKVSLAKLASRF